jgi:hypothetical protein
LKLLENIRRRRTVQQYAVTRPDVELDRKRRARVASHKHLRAQRVDGDANLPRGLHPPEVQ